MIIIKLPTRQTVSTQRAVFMFVSDFSVGHASSGLDDDALRRVVHAESQKVWRDRKQVSVWCCFLNVLLCFFLYSFFIRKRQNNNTIDSNFTIRQLCQGWFSELDRHISLTVADGNSSNRDRALGCAAALASSNRQSAFYVNFINFCWLSLSLYLNFFCF